MKIKMRTMAAGPHGNLAAGQIHNVEQDFGAALVAGGYAEEIKEPKATPTREGKPKVDGKKETADAPPKETTTGRGQGGRRRR